VSELIDKSGIVKKEYYAMKKEADKEKSFVNKGGNVSSNSTKILHYLDKFF